MNFLVNCSNLKAGGGLQVADSICGQLVKYPQHHFVVVLSNYLDTTKERINSYSNVEVLTYNIPNSFRTIVLGRDKTLERLVNINNINAVLTVFGPSRWKPQVPHLSGFALPQLVIPESPYFTRMNRMERIKWYFWKAIRKWSLKRSANIFWTENPYISDRLKVLMKGQADVYTASNYYNQVFDMPEKWKRSIILPPFQGVTCLTVASPSKHKNFGIIVDIIRYLRKTYPNFKVRFVLTCKYEQWPLADDVMESVVYVGKTDVSECPHLYNQADIMFMPTLLECFSATYPEAMRMGVPIVTTDLEFARGLCGDAACYYSAIEAEAAAEAIYKVSCDKEYAKRLVDNGKEQLKSFDNYEQRTKKLVKILEDIAY